MHNVFGPRLDNVTDLTVQEKSYDAMRALFFNLIAENTK